MTAIVAGGVGGVAQPAGEHETRGQVLGRILRGGGICLIIGGKASNFTEELREHRQFVYWDSDDNSMITRPVPTNTRFIYVLKFVRHALTASLYEQARARNIPLTWTSTGELRKDLEEAMTAPAPRLVKDGAVVLPKAPVETARVPVPPTFVPPAYEEDARVSLAVPRGMISQIVEELDRPEEMNIVSARRILAVALARGIKTTERSVSQSIYKHRKRTAGALSPAAVTPSASQRPPAEKPAPAVPDDVIGFDEIDRMLVDARAALELITEHVRGLKKVVTKRMAQHERLKKLLED